jgi:glycine cleavage system T protein
MANELPDRAQAVVVGGGVIGCSVAYHLARLGWTDVVLLERRQLSCGTTWHAAGLVGQLRATHNLTRLARYTAELFEELEAETGQATGFRRNGSLSVATHGERFEELRRGAAMARRFGLPVDVVTAEEIRGLHPLVETADLVGGVFLPDDGQINPADLTAAYAKGARDRGVRILENTPVTAIRTRGDRVTGVATPRGEVASEVVVNCAGMWARELGASCGVNVPLHAAEHFYLVTEPLPEIPAGLPVLRDPDGYTYYKEDAGKLLVGAFEPVAKPWGMDGIPEDFCFETLPEDWEHFEPVMERALHRVPLLGRAGIALFFNGPESFTPDDRYILGEAPELRGCFVAAGFNSIGIQSSGGAGMALAEWIVRGRPPMDLWDVDIRRWMPFQRNRRYLRDRTVEGLGLLYAMHWPFRQYETARGVRRSPLHERLAVRRACFGEAAGWERPNWFAPAGLEPRYEYSYRRQNWFEASAAEHRATREGVALFDLSSFAKIRLEGPDAESVLGRLSANEVGVAPGRVVYTQWLNERGGIEADLTATRLAEDTYLLVTGATQQTRDLDWLRRHLPAQARAVATDVTSGYAVLGLMGPRARELLSTLTPEDVSDPALPYGVSREIELGYALVRVSRVSYAGELGFEIYVPSEFATGVYDAVVAAGEAVDLVHAGFHALDSLRLEKGFRHFGHDIGPDDDPLQAGLGFAVAWGKGGGFIGREALLEARGRPLQRRLVQLVLEDPEPLLYHEEPVWRDGRRVGWVTSGAYGHTLGGAVALAYVEDPDGIDADFVRDGRFEVEIGGDRHPARASLRPRYDPAGARMRG